MSGQETQNCGNCGWSQSMTDQEHAVPEGPNRVACMWMYAPTNVMPMSIHPNITFMYAHEGYGCRCWRPKI